MRNPAHVIGWFAAGAALTVLFYIPVWMVLGIATHGSGIHPDYWQIDTPGQVFPLAAVVTTLLLLAVGRFRFSK